MFVLQSKTFINSSLKKTNITAVKQQYHVREANISRFRRKHITSLENLVFKRSRNATVDGNENVTV